MKSILKCIPILLLAVVVGNPLTLFASNDGRLIGKIKSQAGEDVIGALVTVFTQGPGTISPSFTHSDRRGAYILANLTPGSYRLQVNHARFSTLSTSDVRVEAGRTASVDIVLQALIDSISNNDDPRNHDLSSVMRSTSNRRLIFRDLQSGIQDETSPQPFSRGGAIRVASGTDSLTQNFPSYLGRGQTGILSNFAFSEPVSAHGRMIVSGQLSSGYDSFWQVRNTYNYRPTPGRDIRLSLGYRRSVFNESGFDGIGRPFQFIAQDPDYHESGLQTIAAGLEASSRILDLLTMEYGVDLTRIYSGTVRNYFSPNFRLTFTPAEGWTIKGSFIAKRSTDTNNLTLPGGEVLNLSEPTSIALTNGEIRVNQLRHSEVSLGKRFRNETSVEVAIYEDHMPGSGTSFLAARAGMEEASAQVLQLREDQSAHQGLRLVVNRKLFDFLTGSISYGYGSGTKSAVSGEAMPTEVLVRDLLNYMQRSYYHVITSQLGAQVPRTKTYVTTMVRWYAGDPVTSLDLFADRLDLMTKGVNVFVRQVIPLPEFMGNGHWEASMDLRNLLDQGFDRIRARDGDIILMRNPRSLRFGLNLNFF